MKKTCCNNSTCLTESKATMSVFSGNFKNPFFH